MKKFLIFLVAIITTVCIGVTFYQFAKNDEIIKFNTQTIYINYGEKLSLDDLGFVRKEASKNTKINFNAGGDEVTSIIKYDELSESYIPTSKGGSTTIKITTTNRKYKSFNIDVVVGVGTEEFPYYITNENQLFEITNTHINDNACFKLVNDIKLTKPHLPIGLDEEGGYHEFTGKFDGGYKTISNLNISTCDYAGLFAIMGANSEVHSLYLKDSSINGEFISVGSIAGICYGTINKVVVSNSAITNNRSNSNTGAVVGLLETDNLNSITAGIMRTYAYTDQNIEILANGNLGGLAGCVNSAIIHACHTKLTLNNNSNSNVGGLVGELIVDTNTYIRESYSQTQIISNAGNCGNIVGNIALRQNIDTSKIIKELVLVGLYFDNTINNFNGIGLDNYNFNNITTFTINGKTTDEMKIKDTYVYYISSSNNIIYWDKVWYLVDGAFPTLTFIGNFNDIVLEDGVTLPTNPEDPGLSNPDNPNSTAIIIYNKQQLLNYFQSSNIVSGNYILNADIDLGGIAWNPIQFSGTFKSSENNNYTISNFNIVGNDLYYAGFFYNLASATISNITFANAKLNSTTNLQTAGIVVGHIRGNVVIKNVNVLNSQINASSKYSGGIVGYVGNVITKIEKCSVQGLLISESTLNAGGIAGYNSKESYIISCKVKNSNDLNSENRIGGICSVNYGTIYDCLFKGNIKSNSSKSNGYFGGIAGVNYSRISYSTAYAEIDITNSSTTESGISSFVGGIAGYNIGSIDNSTVYGDEFIAKNSTGIVYLAGLTGFNSGELKYCVADILQIGSIHNNIYTAGLSVFNYGGTIYGCFAFGNLSGYQVAGLVRTNTNNGTIDSCMSGTNEVQSSNNNSNIENGFITIPESLEQTTVNSQIFKRATYKGIQLASFVYEISSGTITNCIVNAELNCTNDNGWIAGFAGFMPCNNDKFGTISHSISNVSFTGIGDKYLDIAQAGLMQKNRTTGTITNCIINSDAKVGDIVISKYSKILWISQDAGSKSNYVVASTEDMLKIETFLDPNKCNFDVTTGLTSSKWVFIKNSCLILPRTYLTVFGYDIIGLG